MRKVDDGEERKKRKQNNVVYSGHLTSLPVDRPNVDRLERRTFANILKNIQMDIDINIYINIHTKI